MASSSDSWMREFNEASKLADDINARISETSSYPPSGPETQRHLSAIRRKITILGTRLDSLESLLAKLPSKQPIVIRESDLPSHQWSLSYLIEDIAQSKRKSLIDTKTMLNNLRSKAKQLAATLNMSNFANRDNLLGPESKSSGIDRTAGLDDHGLVGLQRQIMSEQDEGLDKLEETVLSTKHIALAVNEELDLHTRLLDNLDEHVVSTDSRLQRVQKRLAILNKRTKGGCSCMCLLLSVVVIVILAVVVWLLIKYL